MEPVRVPGARAGSGRGAREGLVGGGGLARRARVAALRRARIKERVLRGEEPGRCNKIIEKLFCNVCLCDFEHLLQNLWIPGNTSHYVKTARTEKKYLFLYTLPTFRIIIRLR